MKILFLSLFLIFSAGAAVADCGHFRGMEYSKCIVRNNWNLQTFKDTGWTRQQCIENATRQCQAVVRTGACMLVYITTSNEYNCH